MPCIAGRARTGGKILHTGAVCYPAYQLVTVGAFVIYVDLPGDIPVGDIFDRNAALGAFDLENIRTERGLLGKRRPQRDGCLEPGYIGRQFFLPISSSCTTAPAGTVVRSNSYFSPSRLSTM